MRMNRTHWRPDTCGCEIMLETDLDQPDVEPAIVEVKPCPLHMPAPAAARGGAPAPVATKSITIGRPRRQHMKERPPRSEGWLVSHEHRRAVGANVLEENRMKNEHIKATAEVLNVPAESVGWSFDQDRRLAVHVRGTGRDERRDLTPQEQLAVATRASEHGERRRGRR